MLVIRDGVGMAYMGRPFAPYLSLGVYLERFDRLRGPNGLSRRRSRFGVFQVWPGEAGSHPRAMALWFLCLIDPAWSSIPWVRLPDPWRPLLGFRPTFNVRASVFSGTGA